MRVRKLTPDGDMQLGNLAEDWLVNSPQAVEQIIGTRLRFWKGEWFLNKDAGTPYYPGMLGKVSNETIKEELSNEIMKTPGVTGIMNVIITRDARRKVTFSADVETEYGMTVISENF